MRTLNEIQASINKLRDELLAIQAAAQDADRDLTQEEIEAVEKINAKIESEELQFSAHQRILDQHRRAAEQIDKPSQPVAKASSTRISYVPNVERERTHGFRNMGEFLMAVHRSSGRPGMPVQVDERIRNAPTTAGNEGAGPDGGFAVPPAFLAGIDNLIQAEDSLWGRTTMYSTSSNNIMLTVNAKTPWDTSGGILAYWDGELDQLTQSKPALERRYLELNKMTCLVPVSNELLRDASMMSTFVPQEMARKMVFKLNLAVVQGNGVSQPLGILNSPALISVAKEGSQVADTLVANNVIKMWSRCYAPSRASAVWLANQDIEPQLYKMSLPGTDNTGAAVTGWGMGIYQPAGGFSQSPYSTLFGRPIIFTQACETLGDLGDIILADLSEYMTIAASSGPQFATSMHLYFDYDAEAFRATWRVAGQPKWGAAMSARDGSATYSPFVALAARA